MVAGKFFELARILYDPAVLKPRIRELAVLGLCSVLDVPYAVYCHRATTNSVGGGSLFWTRKP